MSRNKREGLYKGHFPRGAWPYKPRRHRRGFSPMFATLRECEIIQRRSKCQKS